MTSALPRQSVIAIMWTRTHTAAFLPEPFSGGKLTLSSARLCQTSSFCRSIVSSFEIVDCSPRFTVRYGHGISIEMLEGTPVMCVKGVQAILTHAILHR